MSKPAESPVPTNADRFRVAATPPPLSRTLTLALLAVFTLVLGACTSPVAAGLEDADANQVVVALESAGVAAEKLPDPQAESLWMVTVGQDDAASALAVLTRENLPPPKAPGVLDTLDEGSIVPSRAAEHAKVIAGTAGDLERSLRAISGVVSARIHLAVAPKDNLATVETEANPTASVLLRHRGATPPIAEGEVQRLVAGAVPGLEPESVAVVTTSAPPAARPPERELARFGPITMIRTSIGWARAIAAGVILLLLVLVGGIVVLWSRLRKVQEQVEARLADEAPEAP